MYRIGKLTEEGKQMFSWQFDETQDMDEVRCVNNLRTGEIVLAIKVSKDVADNLAVKIHPRQILTQKGVWKMWEDAYNFYITREGDRI